LRVIQARNKLDNRFYAIKRIRLRSDDPDYNKRIMREVITLSRLHHDHIVRYYQAWTEVEGTVASPSVESVRPPR